ncbi:MAG TPA: hypothetical protein VH518_02310 [Tepidisphaeraceae bacterium]|jgi:hypothetical protein
MRRLGRIGLFVVAAATLLAPRSALARIKLITLPVRERVEIQLDNANATLVEEERIVPLVKGENQVDFSWANTQIDPNTIVFRVIAPVGERKLDVNVISVSYPPNEPSLIWSVGSSDSGSATVRISYLLGNMSKSFNYRAVASKDETTLTLAQYIRLQNFANEEFGSTDLWAGFGREFHKPIGLNETKEMLMARFADVPVKKTYTCDPDEFGWLDQPQQKLRVPMHYVIKNDKNSHLGTAALPYGKVRIFIQGNQNPNEDSTAFLGEDWGQFTPIDDEMKLYLGVAQDIVVRRTIERNNRKRVAGNLYDQELIVKYEIENFKDKPVTLDVQENVRSLRDQFFGATGRDVQWELGNETTFQGGYDKEKSTFEKLIFHADLPARDKDGKAQKIIQKLHITLKNEW